MPVSHETGQQIQSTLLEYCEAIDRADFAALAALFEHGRWFIMDEPGSAPMRAWLDEHIILYDGQTRTRHELSNVSVEPGERPDAVAFRCYVTIHQYQPSGPPQLLAHVRFHGTFVEREGRWWWSEHEMIADYAGDLGGHIRGGLAAVV